MENTTKTKNALEKRGAPRPLVVRTFLTVYLILTVGAVINGVVRFF